MLTYSKESQDKTLRLLSVVIATYERETHLNESLSFLQSLDVNVVVVDGSKSSSNSLRLIDDSRVKYIHAPGVRHQQRMAIAGQHLESPYAITMCDDEYYSPSALASAVKYLEANRDFSSCSGQAIGFATHGGKLSWQAAYPELAGFSENSKSGVNRFSKHLSNYRLASYFGVLRSSLWAKCWKEISQAEFSPYAISEIQFEGAVSFAGGMMVLPELMWFRNLSNPPIRNSLDPDYPVRIEISEWWKNKSYRDEIKGFLAHFTAILTSVASTDGAQTARATEKMVARAFSRYSRHTSLASQKLQNRISHLRTLMNSKRVNPAPLIWDYSIEHALSEATHFDSAWAAVISNRIRNFYRIG